MALFNKKTVDTNLSERDKLEARYKGSRNNILLVVAFTLVNTILLIVGSGSYFLFSASVPYYVTLFGMLYTGKMPADYYVGIEDFVPMDSSFFIVAVVIAVVVIGLYALSWFLSKKHHGWLIFALVFFAIDTLALFYFGGFSADMILDYVFHAWVIVSLASGISAASKLKKLPEEQPVMVDANGMPQMTGVSPDLMSGYAPNNNAYYPTTPVEPASTPVEAPVEAPVEVSVEAPVEAQTTDVTE